MRDVGSQLAEYFEAATERIDPADVMAQARVGEPLSRRPASQRLRPAWAVAAGFVGVLVLVGGALLAGWLMRGQPVVDTGPVGTPIAEPSAGWGWWPLVVAAAVIGVIVLVFRRLRRATKEVEMQTTEEQQPQTTEAQPTHRSRRAWFIGLAILVVAAGAIAAWAITQANQTDDMEIATEFADTWVDAWQTRGGDELAAWFTEDGVWVDGIGAFDGRTDISRHVATYGLFTTAERGDIAEVEAGVFVFPIEAVWYDGDWAGEVEVRFEGDLVAHAELVTWEEVD